MSAAIFNGPAVKLLKNILKFKDGTELTSTQAAALSTITSDVQAQLDDKIDATEKGAALGVATLDAGGKVPVSQLPNSILEYKGTWNASTNSPTLADGVGNAGDVYIVSVAGTQDLGSGSISFAVSDWVVYDGALWQKAANSNSVASVNGFTGIVTLTTADISEVTNLYFTDARARAAITGAASTVTDTDLTADRALTSSGSGKIAASSTTATELGYVSGVTSAIQTQLSGKEPTITTLPISKGGTNSGASLNNNRVIQSSGGAIVEAAAITANRALASDANGIPVHTTVTDTELGYVSGVTSAIQTQLGNKADLGANIFTGLQTAPRFRATGQTADPSSPLEGTFYYNDGTSRPEGMYVYDGAAWQPVGANAGYIATDWVSYTPTFTGFGTVSNVEAYYKREGSNLRVVAYWTAGTTTAVQAKLSLPSGLSIDTTKSLTSGRRIAGTAYFNGTTTAVALPASARGPGIVIIDTADAATVSFSQTVDTDSAAANSYFRFDTGSEVSGSNNAQSCEFLVPISGWATNTAAAVQSINARAKNSSTSISGTLATVVWTTEDYDTDSALASGVFTVPSSGKYHIDTALAVAATFALNNTSTMEVQVNGTARAVKTQYIPAAITNESISISTDLQLTAGDTVRVQYATSGTTPSIVSSDTKNFFSISKIGN